MKYRSRTEIVSMILDAADGGTVLKINQYTHTHF